MKTKLVAIMVHDVEIEEFARSLGKKYCGPDCTELTTFNINLDKDILNLEDVEDNGGNYAVEYDGWIYAISEYKTLEDINKELT